MRYANLKVLALVTAVVGCGSDPSPTTLDAGLDSPPLDAPIGLDAIDDMGSTTDSPTDGGFPYPAAIWSRRADHGGYSKLLNESIPSGANAQLTCGALVAKRTWVGEAGVGLDFGSGARANAGVFRLRLADDGKECGQLSAPEVLRFDDYSLPDGRLMSVEDVTDGILVSTASKGAAFGRVFLNGGMMGGPVTAGAYTDGYPRGHVVQTVVTNPYLGV
ncbi:hypothetical protein BH09MYX1_BH09MYX1_40170 [soil metagenome]